MLGVGMIPARTSAVPEARWASAMDERQFRDQISVGRLGVTGPARGQGVQGGAGARTGRRVGAAVAGEAAR